MIQGWVGQAPPGGWGSSGVEPSRRPSTPQQGVLLIFRCEVKCRKCLDPKFTSQKWSPPPAEGDSGGWVRLPPSPGSLKYCRCTFPSISVSVLCLVACVMACISVSAVSFVCKELSIIRPFLSVSTFKLCNKCNKPQSGYFSKTSPQCLRVPLCKQVRASHQICISACASPLFAQTQESIAVLRVFWPSFTHWSSFAPLYQATSLQNRPPPKPPK